MKSIDCKGGLVFFLQNKADQIQIFIISFDFEAYPDKDHGIYGGKTRFQLFSKISEWLFTNL
jgi:hypothetical protein